MKVVLESSHVRKEVIGACGASEFTSAELNQILGERG
jgi:hypothetical protein